MVDPDVPWPKDGDPVTVGYAPPPYVRWAGAYVSIPGGFTVVHVDVVDDHVRHVLERDTAVTGYLNVSAAAVNGLEAVED